MDFYHISVFFVFVIFVIHAGILIVTMIVFARHEADWNWWQAGIVSTLFAVLMWGLHFAVMAWWPGWMMLGLLAIYGLCYALLGVAIYQVFCVSRGSAVLCALTAGTLWILCYFGLGRSLGGVGMDLEYVSHGGKLNDRDYCVSLISTNLNPEYIQKAGPNLKFHILQWRFRDMAWDASKTSMEELNHLLDETGRDVRRTLSMGELHRFERLYLRNHFEPLVVEAYEPGETPAVKYRSPSGVVESFSLRQKFDHQRSRDDILKLIPDEETAISLLQDPNLDFQRWGMEWILKRPNPPATLPDAAVKNVTQTFLDRLDRSKTSRVTFYGARDTAKAFLTRYGGAEAKRLLAAP